MNSNNNNNVVVSKVTIQWLIENFTCWERDYHGLYIESPTSSSLPGFKISLDPTVKDEMKLWCFFGKLRLQEGELSVYANGFFVRSVKLRIQSEIAKEEVNICLPSNLREILESQEEDYITLQFQFSAPGLPVKVHMCTSLEVISVLTLPFTGSELLEDLGEEPKLLLAITYNRPSEEKEEVLHLQRALVDDVSKAVDLQLRPVTNWAFHNVWVKSRLRVLDGEDILPLGGVSRYIFYGVRKEPWTISRLQERDLSVTDRKIVLHLKFLSGKIKYSAPGENQLSPSHMPSPSDEIKNSSSLEEDLMRLYRDKEFTDCELHCGTTTFAVHRAILNARSPVFQQLLMERPSSVNIEDLDPPTLNHLLVFLYTGIVEDLQVDSAIQLYKATDKYKVPSLKAECVAFLCKNISVESACRILSLADQYEEEELIYSAHHFIMRNFSRVSKSRDWLFLMMSDPQLLIKTVTKLAENGYF